MRPLSCAILQLACLGLFTGHQSSTGSQTASLMHKQFSRLFSLMFATVTFAKANFKDTYIQGVIKIPSLNRSYKVTFRDLRYRETKNIFIIYHNSPQLSGAR